MLSKKIIILIIIILSINNYCQSLYIGFGSGVTKIQGNNYFTKDLGNAGAHYVNGVVSMFEGLDFSIGYELAIKFRYELNNTPFSLLGQIYYIPFRGHQTAEIYNFYRQIISEDVTTIINIWSFRIGGRYSVDVDKVKPYASVLFLLNYWGDTWLQFEYFDNIEQWRNYKNGIRYGLNLGFGVGYEAIKNVDFEIEANYNYMNLWNRRGANPIDEIHPSVEEKMNTLNVELSVYYRFL